MKDNNGNQDEKEMTELALILNFLNEQNIEYDLEPPRKFIGWKKINDNVSILETEPINF
jgi:hypothetical protein